MKYINHKNPSMWSGPGRMLLYLAALASAVWLLIPDSPLRSLLRLSDPSDLLDDIFEIQPESVSPDTATRLLLFGDENAADYATRWHPLWMSEPENPAWFSRYAAMRLVEDDILDSKLLDEASRIDPDNGFWHLVAACIDADDALEKITVVKTETQSEETEWHARNQEEVLRRIDAIHHAASRARLTSRHLEWHQAAIPQMKPADGFARKLQTIAWLSGEILYGGTHLWKLPRLQEAGLRVAIERNDADLAARIIRDWHGICLSLTKDGTSLVGIMITHDLVTMPVDFFHKAALHLDLEHEVALLQPVLAVAREIERKREIARNMPMRDDIRKVRENKISWLGVTAMGRGPQVLINRPDDLGEADYHPTLRMEHAYFERMMVPPIAVITSLSLAAFAAFWLSADRSKRAFAIRTVLLPPRWKLATLGLIAGAGPLLWYLFITRFTPLGWHEWSLNHGVPTLIVQWTSLVFLILFFPGLLAAILLERKGRRLASRWPGGSKARVFISVCIIFALPASGMILFGADSEDRHLEFFWWLSLACMAGTAIASVFSGWFQRKSPWGKSPRRLAASLFAAHARILTLVLLAGWAFLTHVEEKAWAQRDTLFVFNPASPALSSQEEEIQRRLSTQAQHILGPAWPEPQPPPGIEASGGR